MHAIQTRPASDVLRPQQSMYDHPMLSSEIVRPVFHREFTRRSDASRLSGRGAKRTFSDVTELPSVSTASTTTLPPLLAPEAKQRASHRANTSYGASNAALAMVANCASKQLRDVDEEAQYNLYQPKQKRIRYKTERRREQCRANQARYRQKQLNHKKSIEHTVQKLRADIPVLELQRNRLLHGGQQNVWNVVVEYFHNFRFGVPVALLRGEGEDPVDQLDNAEIKQLRAFLCSSMTEDLNLGERTGVEALMEQWRLYSSSFQSLYLQLDRIERTSDQFVSVTAMLNVTVSDTTLENVFPHLTDKTLQSRLLGQRLQLPCSLCFEWDAAACRVSRLETTMNFMTPLTKVLGNLSDVAFVLEHALITRDGAVGIQNS